MQSNFRWILRLCDARSPEKPILEKVWPGRNGWLVRNEAGRVAICHGRNRPMALLLEGSFMNKIAMLSASLLTFGVLFAPAAHAAEDSMMKKDSMHMKPMHHMKKDAMMHKDSMMKKDKMMKDDAPAK
jgi:pentapeptide MXKDX repeat protein